MERFESEASDISMQQMRMDWTNNIADMAFI